MTTAHTDTLFKETALAYEEPQSLVSDSEIQEIIRNIPGLEYRLSYITEAEESEFLNWIDEQPWITDLKRRVQHYGWRYDYKARKVDSSMQIGNLPEPLANLADSLRKDGLIASVPDQVIVNEYEPGQGIARHVDCEPCFGDTILTLTLGSGCIMDFTEAERTGDKLAFKKPAEPENKVSVWLEPRSVVSMKGDSRWWWFHGIAARKSDKWQGQTYERKRRVSLTFRKVVFNG